MDSSSDEEDIEKFQEATATEFINDHILKRNKQREDLKVIKGVPLHLPSLRPVKDDQEQFNLLDVTPEFQKFVAKRLGEYLEKKLQKRLASKIEHKRKRKRKETGIKLLSNSKSYISLEEENCGTVKAKKIEIRQRTIDHENVDEDVKVKSCAVSPDDVLSKKGTEFWTERRKSEVFCYKHTKNGQLVCIEQTFK